MFKGDMTRYLLMSMNLGIRNSKHDFILVTTDSRPVIAFIRTYIENNRKICLNSQRAPDLSADPSNVKPPQYRHIQ